ncbi:29472_t:CDS:2, partial [Gigaspora margarita]
TEKIVEKSPNPENDKNLDICSKTISGGIECNTFTSAQMICNFAKNTLSSVNKISIHIDNKTPITYDKLNPESTLKEVREKFSNSEEQTRIYEYMNFVGPYGIIY